MSAAKGNANRNSGDQGIPDEPPESFTDYIVRLGREKDASGEWKPTVHVLLPDGSEHAFRDQSIIIDDNLGDQDVGLCALLLTNDGNPVFHATTNEPVILSVPPMLLRFEPKPDPDQMITQAKAAKLADIDRTTLWQAICRGELDKHKVGGKHSRLNEGQVRDWINQRWKKGK